MLRVTSFVHSVIGAMLVGVCIGPFASLFLTLILTGHLYPTLDVFLVFLFWCEVFAVAGAVMGWGASGAAKIGSRLDLVVSLLVGVLSGLSVFASCWSSWGDINLP